MRTVGELLRVKGDVVYSVLPETKVFDALQVMANRNIGAVLVIEAGRLVGILSERDYARKVILLGKSSKDTAVGEIMTSRVVWVCADDTIEECMALMTNKHVRHLPVIQGGRLIGVVSIGDVVKAIMSEQEVLIEDLKNYIVGTLPSN